MNTSSTNPNITKAVVLIAATLSIDERYARHIESLQGGKCPVELLPSQDYQKQGQFLALIKREDRRVFVIGDNTVPKQEMAQAVAQGAIFVHLKMEHGNVKGDWANATPGQQYLAVSTPEEIKAFRENRALQPA